MPAGPPAAYKTKVATRIELPTREERETILEQAGYNLFDIDADDVYIDLLTDSGTGAMSDDQWAALMRGDEAYAGSKSFHELEAAVSEVMGFDRIVPAHQGRGAEHLLYGALVEDGDVVINNTHFDTTRAHIAAQGGDPVDCPADDAWNLDGDAPFKGDLAIDDARDTIQSVGADNVPAIVLTLTNNSVAGQPVSVDNVREARTLADEIDATLVIDACRFAENAALVQQRDPDHADDSIADIVREQLGYADAIVMSGKKDGLVNAGGFVAIADDPSLENLYETCRQRGILYEGFDTYGGMTGRDMAAMAVGLREAIDPAYLTDRRQTVHALADALLDADIPIYQPPGGHAIYVDAGTFFPNLSPEEFPGQALACELYREGGVRATELGSLAFPDTDRPELGSLAFPDTDRPELTRLAIPRRMYHTEHRNHVVDTFETIADRRESVSGYRIVGEPAIPELRHFTADLEPLETASTTTQ